MVRGLISRLAEKGEEDWVGWLCCELAVQVCMHPCFPGDILWHLMRIKTNECCIVVLPYQ